MPQGGRVVTGRFMPEGVMVSVPTYSLLRNEFAFEKASEYVPERWRTSDTEKQQQMAKAHLPFSTGPRVCVGRNITYFEQILFITTLVQNFDLQIPEGSK